MAFLSSDLVHILRTAVYRSIPVTGVSNGMAGGADFIFICINQGLAALVIQIPAVTALVRSSGASTMSLL